MAEHTRRHICLSTCFWLGLGVPLGKSLVGTGIIPVFARSSIDHNWHRNERLSKAFGDLRPSHFLLGQVDIDPVSTQRSTNYNPFLAVK